jgi:putative transposase
MMTAQRPAYDSDLNDAEWERIRPLIPKHPPNGRLPTIRKREIVNAIFYLNKTGCQWRSLPHDFPCWSTVHCYYRKWRRAGVWPAIVDELRRDIRAAEGKSPEPTAAIVDSQSVKTTEKGGRMGTMRARKSTGESVIFS